MKLIKPRTELLIQPNGLDGVYKQVELAGRTCYKSENKITEDSAKPFVDRMIASNHTAMLEQGTVYLSIPRSIRCRKMIRAPYSRLNISNSHYHLTTNLRVIYEYKQDSWLQYICEPTKFHEKRYTFKLITDRGLSHELVRHRVFSFAQESTRYCNYSKDKFGGAITFIIPSWADSLEEDVLEYSSLEITPKEATFMQNCYNSEKNYLAMLDAGATPQEARQVLSNAIKTEICMTGFASDWRFFFDLRFFEKTGKVHPDMKHLATLMKAEAEKQGIWNDIMKQSSKFK